MYIRRNVFVLLVSDGNVIPDLVSMSSSVCFPPHLVKCHSRVAIKIDKENFLVFSEIIEPILHYVFFSTFECSIRNF